MNIHLYPLLILPLLPLQALAQTPSPTPADSTGPKTYQVGAVTVSARKKTTAKLQGAQGGDLLLKDELFKAACCNLGESFSTNPSVDVSYDDAATGAKQIKLLGLSGLYVQMLAENIPTLRGASNPFGLDYVPGTWMKSIQVSKGAATVKNGYESITGQINLEYLKPEDTPALHANLYGDTKSRAEANADANIHLNSHLSTEVLTHYENQWGHHDDNHDNFLDKPRRRQVNLQNRWLYKGDRYIFHGGISGLSEKRRGGQLAHVMAPGLERYQIRLDNDHYELYQKHAFILDPAHGTNVALVANGVYHDESAQYGHKLYDVTQKSLYAQLMVESQLSTLHSLSAGLSLVHDYYKQHLGLSTADPQAYWQIDATQLGRRRETVPGAYAQYTFNKDDKWIAMAGLRLDHSSLYGTFLTPRLHLKWAPSRLVTLRLSAGKGYRSPHALVERHYLLASGRQLTIGNLRQESAWNYGTSLAFNVPLGEHILNLGAEYYYTRFHNQAVVDYDSDPHQIIVDNLQGKSYSHVFQLDATYPIISSLTLTAAWRWNDARSTYGGKRLRVPMQSRYKSLFSLSYKPGMGLWQADATLQLNGGGRLPSSLITQPRFHSYPQLQAQVTRNFRHLSVYVGGENLTNFRQRQTIMGADNPWGEAFESTLVWGPVHGRMFYAGIRINFEKF